MNGSLTTAAAIDITPSARRKPKRLGEKRASSTYCQFLTFTKSSRCPTNSTRGYWPVKTTSVCCSSFSLTRPRLPFWSLDDGNLPDITFGLHTWDQQLRPHVHLHGLVASGALSSDGRWRAGGGRFLFPVRALSKMFRAKFLCGMPLPRNYRP